MVEVGYGFSVVEVVLRITVKLSAMVSGSCGWVLTSRYFQLWRRIFGGGGGGGWLYGGCLLWWRELGFLGRG